MESAKKAEQFIGRPMMAMDSEFKSVYTALDDPQSNWCEAIRAMFKPGPRVWSGAEAVAKMQHMNSLYARFEEEERKVEEGYKGDAGFAT